ncbi:DUF1996 domain-containing protein [Streptomyces roseoverticillatus]|uniref:DUF1996 domain-containing protein n=1 Tax=Streptomyces roseoverticillatus TaxID=66429 RepID=UPI0034097F56
MMRNRARRPRGRRSGRAVALPIAAVVAAAGVAAGSWALFFQSSGEKTEAVTISCPDVANLLTNVPVAARQAVDMSVASLNEQLNNAVTQLDQARAAGAQNSNDVLLTDLERQRRQSLGTMSAAITQAAGQPPSLEKMAPCVFKRQAVDNSGQSVSALAGRNGKRNRNRNGNGDGDAADSGLSRRDFADITKVEPNVENPRQQRNASVGSFVSECGRNENQHFNSDNVIVAPGVSNGAHHMHDYVGNLTTDANSDLDSLKASGTTCADGDRSAHYWPVLRLLDGSRERDAAAPGGGRDKNVGKILTPSSVTLSYKGNAVSNVTPMPQDMRLITGDAKAFTNGQKDARASWSCTGFENRELKTKYPVCPPGSQVVRSLKFPDCWDGRNLDSANHRTHVAFSNDNNTCKKGFQAIPQLTQRLTYDVPPNSFFAIDSFPEQRHQPVTDHGDFINVMTPGQAKRAADCINLGQQCKG